jgi:hypothetical protein
MQVWNIAGFIASVLVLMAFCMRHMTSLRVIASSSASFVLKTIGRTALAQPIGHSRRL